MGIVVITLDTNCIVNAFDNSHKSPTSLDELKRILELGNLKVIDLAITTRVESDLRQDNNENRKAAMLSLLKNFNVVGSIGRWDNTTWDGGDRWSDASTRKISEEIQGIVFPGLTKSDRRYQNKQNDIDQLHGHLMNHRGVFITDDRGILKRGDQLANSLGIIVRSPKEFLEYFDRLIDQRAQFSSDSRKIDSHYHMQALLGRAQFDYSNNNHQFAIGDSHFLFQTKWSKASNTSIYAYNDDPSIHGVAVAKGANDISDVRDASIYDYSSRYRTVKKGEIVIWKNANNLYAATKIINIKDDTRGDERDELIFSYVILENGGADFGAS